jgi:hypothetical protein
MNTKVFALSFLLAFANAGPVAEPEADADADAQLIGYTGHAVPIAAPLAYHGGVHAAPNCVTVNEILTTQNCIPSTQNICNTVTVDTEEIEYVKLCKSFTDTLCDAPVAPIAESYHAIAKREAEAEADPEADAQYWGGYGYAHHGAALHAAPLHADVHALQAAPLVAPTAHAVGHSIQATVRHACREVTTERCVDNPQVKVVPVDVEHCHVITKVACEPIDNLIPVTTCEAVTSTHISHAAYAAPVVHAAPLVAHHAAPVHAAYAGAGYAGYHY